MIYISSVFMLSAQFINFLSKLIIKSLKKKHCLNLFKTIKNIEITKKNTITKKKNTTKTCLKPLKILKSLRKKSLKKSCKCKNSIKKKIFFEWQR